MLTAKSKAELTSPFGPHGTHPPLLETPADDLPLDLLDRHRLLVDAQDAGLLAGCRTDQPGELGEVVGRVQTGERVLPLVAEHQVIEVRDDVSERASLIAERDPAIHAARGLLARLVGREILLHTAPVVQTLTDRPVRRRLPLVLEEAADVTHCRSPLRSGR